MLAEKKKSPLEIHNEAIKAADNLKAHYLKLFEILMVVEAELIYLQFEVPSFFLYCVELLGLSRNVAHDFVTVVRKSLEVPQLATAIREQRLTISKARKICSVVTPDDYKGWIDLAETCSCRVVEKVVAMANPREAVQESMKYVAGDVLEFKMAVSEEWGKMLEKTKDLLSQKTHRAFSSEEGLFILMRDYCQKHDPVEKAKRAHEKVRTSEAKYQNSVVKAAPPATRYRPAAVEHLVDLRDQNQCAYVNRDGQRCSSKRWLNKHHIHGFADGGDHSPDNLETLCWGHHKIRHMNLDDCNSSRDDRISWPSVGGPV